MKNKLATITHTITNQLATDESNPFSLKTLIDDAHLDTASLEKLAITITIPKNRTVHVVDDLHALSTNNNTIEFILKENSKLTYKLALVDHALDELYAKKRCGRKKP